MSLSATLMVNSSPVEKIGKTLSEGLIFSVNLKEDTSVLRPVLILTTISDTPITGYNYMYIEEFRRYYFIDDIKSIRNNVWEISAHVDVLQTYRDKILSNSVILEGSENTGVNKYLHDDNVFIVNCKHKTDIINFPYGLLDSGQFILITAGG